MGSDAPTMEKQPVLPSRRDFLKLGALLALSASCAPKEAGAENEYLELKNGARLLLKTPDSPKQYVSVTVNFEPGIRPLQLESGHVYSEGENGIRYIPRGFVRDSFIDRIPGEILDTRLVRLEKNPDLNENVTVGFYSQPGRFVINSRRLGDLEPKDNLVGIAVSSLYDDYLNNPKNPAPYETSRQTFKDSNSDEIKSRRYGQGWLIGRLNPDVAGKPAVWFFGYVSDARAMTPLVPAAAR